MCNTRVCYSKAEYIKIKNPKYILSYFMMHFTISNIYMYYFSDPLPGLQTYSLYILFK